MVMKRVALLGLLLLVAPSAVGAASNAACLNNYYKAKNAACVDAVIENMYVLSPEQAAKGTVIFQGTVGFLSEIFRTQRQEKERILRKGAPPLVRGIFVEALARAGLLDEAREYAEANALAEGLKRFLAQGSAPLSSLRPGSSPSDNDLLIGAYMATGDAGHIRRILENYNGVSDAIASDAFRIGFRQRKFDSKLMSKEREGKMMQAACLKYECKANMQSFMRVMTLSSAFWALQSLAQQDDGIKKAFADFFNADPRLKKLLSIEQAAFSNYMTLLMAQSALKSDPSIEAFLSSYERLGSPKEAEAALVKSPLFEKKN